VKSWQYFRTHGTPLNSVSYSLSYDVVRFDCSRSKWGLKRNSCAKCIKTNATRPLRR